MNDWFEYVIVAAILVWSCYFVVRRFFPKTSFKLQQAVAHQATQMGFARAGKWLQPTVSQSGCSSGCSSCGTEDSACDTTNPANTSNSVPDQPVQWRPSAKK